MASFLASKISSTLSFISKRKIIQFKKCWLRVGAAVAQWKCERKMINRKQSARWQHLSRLKAGAFFSLQKN
jgi:hypothetical protein